MADKERLQIELRLSFWLSGSTVTYGLPAFITVDARVSPESTYTTEVVPSESNQHTSTQLPSSTVR